MQDNPLEPGTYAAKNPKTGLIEIIDMKSGAVLAVQRSTYHQNIGARTAMIEHVLADGSKVLLERGVDPASVMHVRAWPYSQLTADLICQLVAEGEPITKICNKEGYPPYHVFTRWRRENSDFSKQLEDARRDRAEAMRDLALAEALAADEDTVNSQKLKHEAYKWAAGVDDQQRYSPKAKVEGSISVPVQLVVNTGIHRQPIREVTDANTNQTENINALSGSSGGAASPDASVGGQGIELEIHPVSSTPAK